MNQKKEKRKYCQHNHSSLHISQQNWMIQAIHALFHQKYESYAKVNIDNLEELEDPVIGHFNPVLKYNANKMM